MTLALRLAPPIVTHPFEVTQMSNRKTLSLALVAALIVAISAVFACRVWAQGSGVSSYKFEQADVRQALQKIFQSAGISYSIAPDVQGVITVDLHNVVFETALQNLLRQVDATYRIEGGVYQVIRHEPTSPPLMTPMGDQRGTPYRSAATPVGSAMVQDNQYLYVLTDKGIYKIKKADLSIVQIQTLLPPSGAFQGHAEYRQKDVRQVLRDLFQSVNVSYTVASDVKGMVSVSEPSAPFEATLTHVLSETDSTYRIEAGVYHIFHRVKAADGVGQ